MIADGTVRARVGVDLPWADDDSLTPRELDAVGAVITTAAIGIANTGTIVLDHGPDQGRRALSLVPDVHVCVVRADQVVSDVLEAVARLRGACAHGGRRERDVTALAGLAAVGAIARRRRA